jgi:hypothetical protein
VSAEAGALLELLIATFDITHIWVRLGVDINMLNQVLLLCERPATHLAYKFLQLAMNCDKVAFQAEPRREFLSASWKSAGLYSLGFVERILYHLVVNSQILLLLSVKVWLNQSCKSLRVLLRRIIIHARVHTLNVGLMLVGIVLLLHVELKLLELLFFDHILKELLRLLHTVCLITLNLEKFHTQPFLLVGHIYT